MPGPKVLYISGMGRSGSTLLANLLAELDGFCSIGELRMLHHDREIGALWCGCGQRAQQCEFWRSVLDRAAGESPYLSLDRVGPLQEKEIRTRPKALRRARRGRDADPESSPQVAYARLVANIYRAVAERTGARVIVDSSKPPPIAYTVSRASDIDLHLLHLVRDPRAVAHAWQRGFRFGSEEYAAEAERASERTGFALRHSWLWGGPYWLWRNLVTEWMFRQYRGGTRYLRVRYEDMARDPAAALAEICEFVGEPPPQLEGLRDGKVRFGAHHIVGGNPALAERGEIAIRPDERWRGEMGRLPKAATAAFALPRLRAYGYRAFPGREA